MNSAQEEMNVNYQQIMSGLLLNAERDVLLAKAAADSHATAKAQARAETLKAALEIYAATHKHAYGVRPWPRGEAQ